MYSNGYRYLIKKHFISKHVFQTIKAIQIYKLQKLHYSHNKFTIQSMLRTVESHVYPRIVVSVVWHYNN
jgi:hypothetical protein